MTKRFALLLLAALFTLAGTACRSAKTPKENPNVATEVETGFKQRWIEQRIAALTAKGTDATTARTQAEQEFRQNFSYLRANDPKKP